MSGHTPSPTHSPPHHLNTLTGGSQVADEQLQHSLTVEEATPAGRGHRAAGLGRGARVCAEAGRGWGAGCAAGVRGPGTGQGSLFDEVLHLLSAQEGVLPLGHSPDQAQLLLAVTQGHSLSPARCTRVRTKGWLPYARRVSLKSPLAHPRVGREGAHKGAGSPFCQVTRCPAGPRGLSLPDRLPESEALPRSSFSWEES